MQGPLHLKFCVKNCDFFFYTTTSKEVVGNMNARQIHPKDMVRSFNFAFLDFIILEKSEKISRDAVDVCF